jgi:hypothetical protein
MSDQSQGPGWWQASDGKWYPPEQAPAAPPPATQQMATPPGGPGAPPPGAPPGVMPGGPAPYVTPPAGGGGSNTGKIVAIVVVLALIAGGVAFALTRSSGGGGGSTKAFCDTAKKLQNDASLNKAFDDPKNIDKAVAAFDELVKAAPKEIKADMQTVQDVFTKLAQAVKSAGNDPSKVFGAILAASAGIDQKKVETAEKNIDAFGKKNCGADFSFSSSSSDEFSFPSDSSFSSSFSSFGSSFGTDSFSFDESSFSSLLSSFSSDFGSDFFSTSS